MEKREGIPGEIMIIQPTEMKPFEIHNALTGDVVASMINQILK